MSYDQRFELDLLDWLVMAFLAKYGAVENMCQLVKYDCLRCILQILWIEVLSQGDVVDQGARSEP
jgi:hypothetical protein